PGVRSPRRTPRAGVRRRRLSRLRPYPVTPGVERGIERPVAHVAVLVGGGPGRLGLDAFAWCDAARDRGFDVREDAAGDTAEERSAKGGTLLGGGQLERDAENRRDDPQPEPSPRAAAGDAPDRRLDTERAQELERVAQPERDPLQHRAAEGAPVVAEAEAGEGATRVWGGVRRALAREVRAEREALGAGRPAPGRAAARLVADTRRAGRAEPARR